MLSVTDYLKKKRSEKSEIKDVDSKFYSLTEIEKSYEIFKSHQTKDSKFVDLLLSDDHYNLTYKDRPYRIKAVKTETNKAIDKIPFNGFTHGFTYEVDRKKNDKGVCRELIKIMLNPERNYNFGKPFTLEQLSKEVIARSKYRPKPRTISRRFTDLRSCDAGFSIVYFKGKVEIDGEVIKDNFYVLADNCRSEAGLIKKHEMIEYQSDYEYLSWFNDKEEVNKEIDSENDE